MSDKKARDENLTGIHISRTRMVNNVAWEMICEGKSIFIAISFDQGNESGTDM